MPPSQTPSQSKRDFYFAIRPYLPEDCEQAMSVVGNGLRDNAPEGHPLHDFWVEYTENSLTDVADVPGHYLSPGSTFFVVTAMSNDETNAQPIVVATTAVKKKSDSVAEVHRVCVKLDFLRFGLGRMLMNHVHQWAKQQGYEKVLACTVTKHVRAVKFYDSLRYTFTHNSVWSANPVITLSHFEKLI